ncbi:uncharacterized protein LOC132563017 [Ylistrum balloti]|uniref:uncharacterized protein LOC132563017 n=1 Tax=Ylistrum balloti TaxID=509963 RepID=UPI002905CCD0|nr:uncharacterized protein LOC132563017 [Ylistrum balloti]
MDQAHQGSIAVKFRDKMLSFKVYLLGAFHFLRKYILYLLSEPEPSIRPGQPRASEIGVNHICLEWVRVGRDDVTHYEIRMKEIGDSAWNKTMVPTENRRPFHRFSGLSQNTGYEFMSRAVYADGSTSEFSCKSLEVRTRFSELNTVLKLCEKIYDGPPNVYRLPLDEMRSKEDKVRKTRLCTFGDSTCLQEKTILMIGPNEGGKSTLINGLVNHSLGVKWEDDCRFKITDDTGTPPNQRSHTKWITCYRVHPIMENNDCVLNIIDTPSLEDGPESVENNQEVFERLRRFLSSDSHMGPSCGVHAVCFVMQANPIHTHGINMALHEVIESITSIFGENVLENIIPILTFADGKRPSVLDFLQATDLKNHHHFVFNNSTLFPPYTEDALLGEALWQFRSRGFDDFLRHLQTMNPCLLTTKPKLQANPHDDQKQEKMIDLQKNRCDIKDKVMDLVATRSDRDTVKKFKAEIGLNQAFTYNEVLYLQEKIRLGQGKYVTNCIVCHTTCHFPCKLTNDEDKVRCAAMKKGNCTVCHQKCVWHMHRNDTFRIEEKTVTVTKTYEGIKAKYKFDVKDDVSADAMLLAIKRVFVSLLEELISLILTTVKSSNSLQGIQQKVEEFIKLIIDSEEQEKTAGYKKRLKILRTIQYNTTLSVADPDAWLKEMGFKDW